MELIDCPKCGNKGLPSIYLPMCTACANIERINSGDIKGYVVIHQTPTQPTINKDDNYNG